MSELLTCLISFILGIVDGCTYFKHISADMLVVVEFCISLLILGNYKCKPGELLNLV